MDSAGSPLPSAKPCPLVWATWLYAGSLVLELALLAYTLTAAHRHTPWPSFELPPGVSPLNGAFAKAVIVLLLVSPWVALMGIPAALLYYLNQRRAWARVALPLYTLLWLPWRPGRVSSVLASPVGAAGLLPWALQLAALVLLFLVPVDNWFRSER